MSDSLVSSKGQYDCQDATVAQLVAQRIRNAWVAGSSPASGLIEKVRFYKKKQVYSKRKELQMGFFSF